jgi:hypothetical protein
MDSDLYIITVDDGNRTVGDILKDHELGLSEAIIKRVCYAVENNLRKVDIALILLNKFTITLHSSSKNYQETLETNLETLIKYEEYELCAEAKKYLDILKNKKSE